MTGPIQGASDDQAALGKIVGISSQTGVIVYDDASSKGGPNALEESPCAERARHVVPVSAICATVVPRPMGREVWSDEARSRPVLEATAARRFGEPLEVAERGLCPASPAPALMNGAPVTLEGCCSDE